MSYPREADMNPDVEQALAKERRAKMIDLNDPEVKVLWDSFRTTIETIAKPGININWFTEFLIIQSLFFAYKDQLSGLPNKKGASIELEAATAVAKKLGMRMSVLYMDGKDFSGINNTLGHDVGDQVIQTLGEAFDKSIRRSTDIKLPLTETEISDEPNIEVGRQGGDEFVAILLGTDIEGATMVASRINQILAQSVDEKVPIYRQTFGRGFEVTIGMAELNPDTDKTGKDVLIRADQHLNLIRQERGEPRRS